MFNTLSTFVTQLRVKYRQWRLPEHAVHRATESLFDEALADLQKNGKFCLDDFEYTNTTIAEARTVFQELESKGFIASVEGEPDTWEPGEFYELLIADLS
jgi:hypothetical protein